MEPEHHNLEQEKNIFQTPKTMEPRLWLVSSNEPRLQKPDGLQSINITG